MVAEAGAAREVVEAAGLTVSRIDTVFELDMHYVGQTHTVAVALPVTVENGTTGITTAIIQQAFEAAYRTSFSRLLPGLGTRIVNLRTAAIGRRPHFDLAALAPGADASLEPPAPAAGRSGLPAPGTRRRSMPASRFPSAPRSPARRSWSSRTPPPWSIPT